jgi:hypothetical protein
MRLLPRTEEPEFWWDTSQKKPRDCMERLRAPLSDKEIDFVRLLP